MPVSKKRSLVLAEVLADKPLCEKIAKLCIGAAAAQRDVERFAEDANWAEEQKQKARESVRQAEENRNAAVAVLLDTLRGMVRESDIDQLKTQLEAESKPTKVKKKTKKISADF